MPDSKHIVVASAEHDDERRHLRLADTRSDEVTSLTTGTGNERFPAVSPDGKKIIYAEIDGELNVVSVSLSGAVVSKPLDTSGYETMPAYAASRPEFAYVTDRNAADEIWIHSPDGSDRPVVTPADFPAASTRYLTSPALSPEGDRVIYGRAGRDGSVALWISSVAGGSPIKLTGDKDALEYGGSWSPDGSHFAFVRLAAGARALVTVKTGGGGAPAILKSNVIVTFLPQWSPTGDWIAFRDRDGIGLISPDGSNTKAVGKIATPHVAFSRNGKLLYGVRKESEHEFLISIDLASGQEKIIGDLGKGLEPRSKHTPGIRFTLSPDGESILYSINTQRSALWMLEGFSTR
jgi:Tol biopolymer transport system component